MRGNVTVLFILGMFLVGAIWITIWAPSIPDSVDNSSSISWWKHKVPSSPIAGLGPLEIKKLTDKKRGELALLNKKIKRRKKSSPWRKKMETKRDELKKQVALAEQQIAKGKTVYDQYCAHCHGAKGEADGQFSNFLPIRPRHLAQANYRFKTTSQGRLPHDEDLYRTLSLGLRGTPMPGFARTLSHEQIWNVIQYIKTFGSKWTRTAFYDRGKPIEGLLGPRPAGPTPPALAKTMPEVYKNNCEKCHGATGRGDGNSAAEQMDTSAGAKTKSPILPRNFHQPWLFKRGHTIEDIALTISRGLDSSGMPEHGPPGPPVGTLTRQQIWALAAYVYDMGKNQPRPTVDKQRRFVCLDVPRWRSVSARVRGPTRD